LTSADQSSGAEYDFNLSELSIFAGVKQMWGFGCFGIRQPGLLGASAIIEAASNRKMRKFA
jgi:hypothetical protein